MLLYASLQGNLLIFQLIVFTSSEMLKSHMNFHFSITSYENGLIEKNCLLQNSLINDQVENPQ